ncbi:hypothetical protein PNOK_0489000 [Pyrrhoderma noxium]|uniref:CCHC-type domain-containing protein n=1 Tax=Pyrrhoderma noxium TaxID=2282107 RepID=A0A286UK13_9AGAM|nr:hypothetical protein PNOK_0489000 [Pyrrhoderma noxium]
MSTSSSGSKRPRSPSATPKGKKTRSFAGFSTNPPPIPIPIPFDFNMEVNNTPVSLSPSSSPFLSPSQSVQPDLSSGSPEEFTREWSNVLKDIAVISSDRVVDPASIMAQVVPIFMRLSNFIFSSVTSPIPIVESEGRHLARKLFYFASENYAQVDGAFNIINEKKLSHTITSIVDDSNIDLTAKVDNLSNQIISLQQSLVGLSASVARISSSAAVNPPPPPKKPTTPPTNTSLSPSSKPSFSSVVKKKHPEPVAHIEEVSSGPFQTVSHKKTRPSTTSPKKATSTETALVKYTQICVFPTNKLRRGIDDISSKVNAINKALPLDKVPKNFYCVMGRITAQGNMVFCFPNTFSFDLIMGFKNIILNTLSLPNDTAISPVTMEHGYYITGVPIKHPDTGLPLTESALLKELKINYPDVPFIKANILPPSNNPKFAGSQLGSANIFVSISDAAKADDIIFNNLPFIIFHAKCRVTHKKEKKPFIFCSRCYKIGSHEASSYKLKSALCKFCTNPSGTSSQHNSHCLHCISEGNLGTDCAHPSTCRNCLGSHTSDSPLCLEWLKFKLHGIYLTRYQAAVRKLRIDL